MKEVKLNPSDYVVSLVPNTHNTFSVWHDGMEEPYTTVLIPRSCNCPHWLYRLRHFGGSCKHHEIVKQKLKNGGIF